jgi:hypothetical protein
VARFGFVGPSYTSQSLTSDAQTCMNMYPETNESGAGKSGLVLYPTPGLKLFCTLAGSSVRGQWVAVGRWFAVSGTNLYEIFSNGTFVSRGTVANDNQSVSMANSSIELVVVSAGNAYSLLLNTNNFLAIPPATFTGTPIKVENIDGFFLIQYANSNQFTISLVLDGRTWPGGQIIGVNFFSDNIVSTISTHREYFVFGQKASVVYYDSGSLQIFDAITASQMEQGCIATFSPAVLDNTVYWLGGDSRGNGMVWKASGYTPQRVSNHAVEFAIQNYATITDAVGYGYQDEGHSFYVLYFPTANKTWVYDVATQMWHERGFWRTDTGAYEAHHSQNHVQAFGNHYVGDWSTGKIYQMDINFFDDAGNPKRFLRRSPHVAAECEWMFHKQLQVDLETGIGPIPPLLDGSGNPRGPQVTLRFSNDGAKTWSNDYTVDCGQAGNYKARAIFRRLGRARDRVYELSGLDPIPWRIVDAYLFADPGYAPQDRLLNTYRKSA